MEQEENFKTVNYRLSNIEKTLSELKDVVLENKLQARDIKDLSAKINNISDMLQSQERRIQVLETKPTQEKAERWQYIVDYIFKGVIAFIAGLIVIKINLK